MCLYSRTESPNIATEDIHVFKVILPCVNHWHAIFQDGKFSYGHLINDQSKSVIDFSDLGYWQVGRGFFHSTQDRSMAVFITGMEGGKIVNCIIPKGTRYYREELDYASEVLIVGRPIKPITKERVKELKRIRIKRKIRDFMMF